MMQSQNTGDYSYIHVDVALPQLNSYCFSNAAYVSFVSQYQNIQQYKTELSAKRHEQKNKEKQLALGFSGSRVSGSSRIGPKPQSSVSPSVMHINVHII